MERVTALINQTIFYKKNVSVKISCINRISVRKNIKKIILAFQKQNLKQGTRTNKNLLATKSTLMTPNYLMTLRGKCPNTEKYRPEITPYLDTFHAV